MACQGPLVKTLVCKVIWRPLQNHPGSFDKASVYSQDPKFFPAEADTHRPDFGESQQDASLDPLAVSAGHEAPISLLCLILGRFHAFLHAVSLTLSIPGVLNNKDFHGQICPGLDCSSKAPGRFKKACPESSRRVRPDLP
jgi:hypothetical protein